MMLKLSIFWYMASILAFIWSKALNSYNPHFCGAFSTRACSLSPLIVVMRHVLNKGISITIWIIHQGPSRNNIQGHYRQVGKTIIEGMAMSHFFKPWCKKILVISLSRFHASTNDPPSLCLKRVIWFLSCDVLLGEKYLAKNAVLSSFHVIMEFDGRDCNLVLLLSLKENMKSLNPIVIRSTMLNL